METTASTIPDTPKTTAVFSTLRWTLALVSLPFGILNFLLPIYGKEVGASTVEIGLLFSSFSIMTVLLRPLIGAGLDRFGRRWFFIAGLAGYGLTMVVFAYATDINGLLFARILQGTASSLLWLAINALVADVSPEKERGRSFGIVSQVTNQGAILGTFLGFSVLFSMEINQGWELLFIGFALAGLAAALFAWKRMPETSPGKILKNQMPGESLSSLLRSKTLVVLLAVTIITGASSAMVSPILMVFLQEKFQAGVEDLAWAFLPAALVWAILPTRLGHLADRFGRKPLMSLALVVAAIVSLLIPVFGSLVVLAILWTAEAVCFAASDPASQALVADVTGNNQRGRAYGLFALAGGLGAVIGPVAGGWLYDSVSQSAPFVANACALAISAMILWIGLRSSNRSQNQRGEREERS